MTSQTAKANHEAKAAGYADAAADEAQPAPASPPPDVPVEPVAPTGYRVMVWYSFTKGDMRDVGRVVLNGIPDIRSEQAVLEVEQILRTNFQLDRVFITNWRVLEA